MHGPLLIVETVLLIAPLLCFGASSIAHQNSVYRNEADKSGGGLSGRVTVVGGEIADYESWRFLVSVETAGNDGRFACAGSLIDWDAVITAASCVVHIEDPLIVKVGIYNRTDKDELEQIAVRKVTMHPDYDESDSFHNDIAVLLLQTATRFRGIFVELVLLPQAGGDYRFNPDCYMIGWGRYDLDKEEMSDVVREKNVDIISHCTCQERWDRSLFRPRIYETNICVDEEDGNVSACQGDSGSPLVCRMEEGWVVVGISSWGSAACHTYPSVFTDNTDYVQWIKSVVDVPEIQWKSTEHGVGPKNDLEKLREASMTSNWSPLQNGKQHGATSGRKK